MNNSDIKVNLEGLKDMKYTSDLLEKSKLEKFKNYSIKDLEEQWYFCAHTLQGFSGLAIEICFQLRNESCWYFSPSPRGRKGSEGTIMNGIDKTRYYKGLPTCAASISKTDNGYRLLVKTSQGTPLVNKTHPTEHGAKLSLNTLVDSMTEIKNAGILSMG